MCVCLCGLSCVVGMVLYDCSLFVVPCLLFVVCCVSLYVVVCWLVLGGVVCSLLRVIMFLFFLFFS